MSRRITQCAAGLVLLVAAGCATGPTPGPELMPYRPIPVRQAVHPVPALSARASLPKAPGRNPTAVAETATNTAVFSPVSAERYLRKGDRIQVTIYAPPQPFTSPHVIDEDGRINVPLLGTMKVAGKSCGDAQREIEKAYLDQKYYKTVTVIIVPPESEYAVAGEVIRPGPYPLSRDMALQSALARAGRLTEWADPHRVFLIRGNDRIEINMDDIKEGRRLDVTIIPGDVIDVPRAKW